MLKLNASYGKKVPAETEYSSQSYHCQIEQELPDGLTLEQLQERIHATFAVVRQAVETELHGAKATQQNTASQSVSLPQPVMPPITQPAPANHATQPASVPANHNASAPPPYQENVTRPSSQASSKQINYLLSLAKRAGWTVQNIMDHFQVNRLEEIDKRQCSKLIEQLSGKAA